MEKLNEKINYVELVEVIKIELTRGDGTEKDPVRSVTQYWDMNGNLLHDDNGYLDSIISSATSDNKS